jgi:hypothetical protein
MLLLTLIITLILTSLIVWGFYWIDKNKNNHPQLYKNRFTLRGLLWIILNSTGF